MPEWWEEHTAQLLDEGEYQHLKIRRYDGGEIVSPWDLLQLIKNEVAGEDAFAVEFYPPTAAVVNEANVRHLWIVPREWLPIGLDR